MGSSFPYTEDGCPWGVSGMVQARQTGVLCVWAEVVCFLSHMNLPFFATLCYPQAPPESAWDGGTGLQRVHEREVCRDEGGVLRPGVVSVLLPHQAEGAQVWGAVQTVSRHQLTSPAQFSDHTPGIPCKQG